MRPRSAPIIALLAAALHASSATATIFTVTSTLDAPDVTIDGVCATATIPPVCTLRAAVQEANASSGGDFINLPAGKYTLKLTGAGEDAAATGDLDIKTDLMIAALGPKTTIIAGKKDRVFQIAAGFAVGMEGLTITKGKVGAKGQSGDEFSGGGIRNEGVLNLNNVIVSGNASSDEGGGIACKGGTLSLTDSTVTKNKAFDNDSGGLDVDGCTATFTRVTISKNKSTSSGGGMILTNGSLGSMTNCTISGNSAKEESGGVRIEAGSTLSLTNVTVAKNTAKEDGGGLDPTGSAGAVTLRNVILDKNKPINCEGTLDLQGGNLESGAGCGLPPTESNLKKLGLGALKNNGGETATHALKKTSPAIDFGVDANCPPTDQRGRLRFDVPGVGTSTCDSGSYELVPGL